MVHQKIIREKLGFDGLLISDDLDMKALRLPIGVSAIKALEAGTDIALHCPGTLAAMQEVASALPEISEKSMKRWEKGAFGAIRRALYQRSRYACGKTCDASRKRRFWA